MTKRAKDKTEHQNLIEELNQKNEDIKSLTAELTKLQDKLKQFEPQTVSNTIINSNKIPGIKLWSDLII
jgi:septal ring factor EnvC (AmiA/AmiB activator)